MVEIRKNKGLTPLQAEIGLEDTVALGTMMLAVGDVDGLVSGAVHTTANTVRPALQLIKTAPGTSIVSSIFFMLMPDQVLVYGDCAINPDPNAAELAQIAIQSADSGAGVRHRAARRHDLLFDRGVRVRRRRRKSPRRDGAGQGAPSRSRRGRTDPVRRRHGRERRPAEGAIQPAGGPRQRVRFSDLNTGNTTYKAVQRSANVVSVGPMLQGLRKPVNDLSRGALVDDIVYTIALTAIQAQAATARRRLWKSRPPPNSAFEFRKLGGRRKTGSSATAASARGGKLAAPMRERRLVGAFPQAHDGAEDDRVRMALDDLLDQAVEGGDARRRELARRSRASSTPRRRNGAAPCAPPCPLKRCASASCRAARRLIEKAPASRSPASVDERARQTISVGGVSERDDSAVTVQPCAAFAVAASDDRHARATAPASHGETRRCRHGAGAVRSRAGLAATKAAAVPAAARRP